MACDVLFRCYFAVILLLLQLLLFFQCRHVVILVIPFQWVSHPLPGVEGDVTGVQVDREEGGTRERDATSLEFYHSTRINALKKDNHIRNS